MTVRFSRSGMERLRDTLRLDLCHVDIHMCHFLQMELCS